MGRLIRASMVSLDGYYEDAEGTIDWSPPEPELHEHANQAVAGLAAIVSLFTLTGDTEYGQDRD